jgi:hypothetical protein
MQRDQARSSGRSIFYWEPEVDQPHKVEPVTEYQSDGEEHIVAYECRYCDSNADSPEVRFGQCVSDEAKRAIDKRILEDEIRRDEIRSQRAADNHYEERMSEALAAAGACPNCESLAACDCFLGED